MTTRTTPRLIRWDIEWWSVFIAFVLLAIAFAGSYPRGLGDAVLHVFIMLSLCLIALRPRFLARRCCVPGVALMHGEKVRLRVAANLQEFPSEPLFRQMFPPITGGWLYLTTERLIFHSRKRTIAMPFKSIRAIYSEPRGGWWWGIYVNARRIHVQTSDATLTIGVRYPHLMRQEIQQQMGAQAKAGEA